jgi:hypothetical protein
LSHVPTALAQHTPRANPQLQIRQNLQKASPEEVYFKAVNSKILDEINAILIVMQMFFKRSSSAVRQDILLFLWIIFFDSFFGSKKEHF